MYDTQNECIDNCQRCHSLCWSTALTHCLQQQGAHTKPDHYRLMMNCAEICQTAANFMLSESVYHHAVCKLCAQICEDCARSCEQTGNMEECMIACRECARSCQSMAIAA